MDAIFIFQFWCLATNPNQTTLKITTTMTDEATTYPIEEEKTNDTANQSALIWSQDIEGPVKWLPDLIKETLRNEFEIARWKWN